MSPSESSYPVPYVGRKLEDQLRAHPYDWVKAGVRAMLELADDDPDRPGLVDTPERFLKAWLELTERPGIPKLLLATTFDDADQAPDEMVVVGPVPFTSVCEHHLLPFEGWAFMAYIPGHRGVVGLSKLPRLLEHYARRPQVQERLTAQITSALDEYVEPLGSACVVRATHTCATMRGVRKPAPMTTSSLTGVFRENASARAEFLALTHNGGHS
jgi:GTP cyclohydrolase I